MKNINNFENFTEGATGSDGISDSSLTGIEGQSITESVKSDENGIIITVKDIIDFLSKYDGNTRVYLDKDGWVNGSDNDEVIGYLFDDWGLENYGSITVNN